MARLDAAIPTSPLVDAGGNIRPEWRAFFTSLWIRTGGALGQSSDTTALEAQLAAEETARQQGDANLGAALTTETQARTTGDNINANAIVSEAEVRSAVDATLVPRTQLCSLWGACNLNFLPTSDPGGGQPWLDGTTLSVGTPSGAMVGIELESATADWTLEDGTAAWIWS